MFSVHASYSHGYVFTSIDCSLTNCRIRFISRLLWHHMGWWSFEGRVSYTWFRSGNREKRLHLSLMHLWLQLAISGITTTKSRPRPWPTQVLNRMIWMTLLGIWYNWLRRKGRSLRFELESFSWRWRIKWLMSWRKGIRRRRGFIWKGKCTTLELKNFVEIDDTSRGYPVPAEQARRPTVQKWVHFLTSAGSSCSAGVMKRSSVRWPHERMIGFTNELTISVARSHNSPSKAQRHSPGLVSSQFLGYYASNRTVSLTDLGSAFRDAATIVLKPTL